MEYRPAVYLLLRQNGEEELIHIAHQMTDLLAFFMAFIENPRQVGSVIPSSRRLLRRLVAAADVASAGTIVELGTGNGASTAAILQAAPAGAKVLAVEVNPRLHALIRDIDDPRLIAHLGDARFLKEILLEHGIGTPDAVISGIPFSTMRMAAASRLAGDIAEVLAPGGRFVAYQVSPRVATLVRPLLGEGRMEMEAFNIPPMRVYRWVKHVDART
jgi:phosphatidylethanolamine/phosphatidyl-N-methylethanolamine N-methyltransferase